MALRTAKSDSDLKGARYNMFPELLRIFMVHFRVAELH